MYEKFITSKIFLQSSVLLSISKSWPLWLSCWFHPEINFFIYFLKNSVFQLSSFSRIFNFKSSGWNDASVGGIWTPCRSNQSFPACHQFWIVCDSWLPKFFTFFDKCSWKQPLKKILNSSLHAFLFLIFFQKDLRWPSQLKIKNEKNYGFSICPFLGTCSLLWVLNSSPDLVILTT